MASKVTMTCCVSLAVIMMSLLVVVHSGPAPVRPSRFDTVDDYVKYLSQINSHYDSKRIGRPERPEQFENVSDYLKYLTNLNSFLASNEKRSSAS